MPIPLLILSDSPSAKSGLGRITRELALHIHEKMSDVYRVGCVGPGFDDRVFLPFPNYPLHEMENWVVTQLPEIWRAFAGQEKGILLVIWDASRLLWLADPNLYCVITNEKSTPELVEKYANLRNFLLNKPFETWTYTAIDAEGPNGKLSFLLGQVLKGIDRVLAYSEWSAKIIEKTIGKKVEALPHGIDPQVWRARGRDKARRKFGQLVFDTDFSVEPGKLLIGIVATNQARKDYGTALQAAAMLLKSHDVLLWIHIDTLERYWSISALLVDYGLQNRAVITHGRLTDEQMTWAYSACDVTWGIGLGEGFGFPIYESLACGIPCIHGDYGGGAEWLPDAFKITPLAFRPEGTFSSMRPVYSAEQWVEASLKVKGQDAKLPDELNWNNLWPRWEKWLRKESMNHPTHATPALIRTVSAHHKAASAGNENSSDFSAFIPHVYREDLLLKAVESVPEYHRNLTVIDNSPNGLGAEAWQGLNRIGYVKVLRPDVPLTCSQTFNLIMKITRERVQKICIWMHSDVEAGPGVAEGLLNFARTYTKEGRKWGVLWTYYDTLSAINTYLTEQIGEWDTNLPQYFTDNDYYRRVKLAGWECIDTLLTDVKHVGSATINSDPYRKMVNSITFPLYVEYYKRKWGGDVGHETFEKPFNWTA